MEYLRAKLDEIKKLECATLVIDLRHVTSIGSTGVNFIVGAYTCVMRRPGGRFVLTGANPRVRQVLALTRLSNFIPLESDLASGLALLGDCARMHDSRNTRDRAFPYPCLPPPLVISKSKPEGTSAIR
jgi:anti-anti-sigma factor